MAYIQINKIIKRFATVTALDSVQLEIAQNEFFGIIGPDGAGKTTLLRVMASLLIPDSGSLMMGDYNPVSDYKKLRSVLGYMPGRFSLYQDLTVEENLKFFATVFGTSIQENYHLIKDIYIQIEPFRKRRAGALSGGMKQKLALCCSLIHKPEILILDEPTTGVDAVSRIEFWEMLKRLQTQGLTIIVSTPYMDDATRCDRVALMQSGKILATGKPGEIISQYGSHLYSIRTTKLYPCLKDVRSLENIQAAYVFGRELHVAVAGNEPSSECIAQQLIALGHDDLIIEDAVVGIEDCFMKLIEN